MPYFADSLPNDGISAKEQMRWQEFMSDTAHQREMDDLKKAGLNPVLSAGGSGASTPSGAQDSSETLMLLKGITDLVKASHGTGKSYVTDPPISYDDLFGIVHEYDTLEGHEGLSFTGWSPGYQNYLDAYDAIERVLPVLAWAVKKVGGPSGKGVWKMAEKKSYYDLFDKNGHLKPPDWINRNVQSSRALYEWQKRNHHGASDR